MNPDPVDPDAPDADSDAPATVAGERFPVVGVGASAGGLNAFTDFLNHLPERTGMAFILIQHLSPSFPSQLPALLQAHTPLPVSEAADGIAVEPDHIYVIAANTTLTFAQGRLRVAPREHTSQPHLAIDLFLRSLAEDRRGRSIGVVLSGTGSDGTLGLAAIKVGGGITFAQDDSAEHGAMPFNAVAHGGVDFVLSAGAIARELGKLGRNGYPDALAAAAAEPDDPSEPLGVEGDLSPVLTLLRAASGIDFTHYRPTTIRRRIARRMHLLGYASLGAYAGHLGADADEAALLLKDILIGVTSFYRDRGAYDTLVETILPQVIAGRSGDDPIRIWVIGCATGQEPYSLAIEMLELLGDMTPRPILQIFATDISDWALAKARAGCFTDAIKVDVPPDRLERYFTREGDGYRICKLVRDLCVFAKHDITEEIPFGRMDLVSCRNVLIYLGPVLQRKVFPTIHFALKPKGFLLLGSSESVGRFGNLFEPVDDRARIYRRIDTPRRLASPTQPVLKGAKDMPRHDPAPSPSVSELQRAADRIVLGRFSPAGVLVTGSLEVIQYRGHTNPYLEQAPGDVSTNLLTMVPFAVAEALRQAIAEARQHSVPVRRQRIAHRRDSQVREIAFEVVPVRIPPAAAETFLILFEEEAHDPALAAPPGPTADLGDSDSPDQRELKQLRYELAAATDYIHSLIERGGVLAEQLKASQEESSSTSEEFRSTNEELQTTKEEVESTNEELITINEELRTANRDLAQASKDLIEQGQLNEAIVVTMRYPLLVLDGELRVVLANQAFLNDFKVLVQETRGRLIYELGNGQWDIPELRRLLEDILPNGSAFDDFEVTHDFTDIGRRVMLLNARRLPGSGARQVVLVIADVTERNRLIKELKTTSAELMRSNAELEQFAAVASHDLQEPLRMISGYVALFERRYREQMDEQGKECMRQISGGAQRLTTMISAILAFSRLGLQAPFEAVDSAIVVRSALANLKRKIEAAAATVTVGALPRITANAHLLVQVFQNLVSNGLKFHSEERAPTVHISAVESEREVTFAVADNGIGMAEADFPRVFQLFQRLNPESRYSGAGIGLATCKKIVEHHHGRIWIESSLGEGSTFFFTMPK